MSDPRLDFLEDWVATFGKRIPAGYVLGTTDGVRQRHIKVGVTDSVLMTTHNLSYQIIDSRRSAGKQV